MAESSLKFQQRGGTGSLNAPAPERYRVGDLTVDVASGVVKRGDETLEILVRFPPRK